MISIVARKGNRAPALWSLVRCPPAVCLLVALGGCETMQQVVGIAPAGHQADGRYIVSAEEEKLPCRQIDDRLEHLSRQIQTLPQLAAQERESQPMTVGSALGRMFGGGDANLKANQDFRKAQAESDALKMLKLKKQCV
jgi:hypothetical protein